MCIRYITGLVRGPDGRVLPWASLRLAVSHIWLPGWVLDTPVLNYQQMLKTFPLESKPEMTNCHTSSGVSVSAKGPHSVEGQKKCNYNI